MNYVAALLESNLITSTCLEVCDHIKTATHLQRIPTALVMLVVFNFRTVIFEFNLHCSFYLVDRAVMQLDYRKRFSFLIHTFK